MEISPFEWKEAWLLEVGGMTEIFAVPGEYFLSCLLSDLFGRDRCCAFTCTSVPTDGHDMLVRVLMLSKVQGLDFSCKIIAGMQGIDFLG